MKINQEVFCYFTVTKVYVNVTFREVELMRRLPRNKMIVRSGYSSFEYLISRVFNVLSF